jgi:hypothetical protein
MVPTICPEPAANMFELYYARCRRSSNTIYASDVDIVAVPTLTLRLLG